MFLLFRSASMKLTDRQDASEGVRKNINSFIDELAPNKEGGTTHGGDGIHPDAKKTGEGILQGAGALAGKLEEAIDRHKTK